MTNEELFLKEGANYFGNRLIYKHKDVGVIAPGASLVLTAEGEDIVATLRNIEDVEVKPAKSVKATTPVKQAKTPKVEPVPSGDREPTLDELLGE